LPNSAHNGYIICMSSATNPHDHVFRQTFGRPDVAGSYFRHNLPNELLEHIDLETLERVSDTFVDPELHPSASDILYTVDRVSDSALYGAYLGEVLCEAAEEDDVSSARVSDDYLSWRTALAASAEFPFPVHGSGTGPAGAPTRIFTGVAGFLPA
jgi:hypothetical protein